MKTALTIAPAQVPAERAIPGLSSFDAALTKVTEAAAAVLVAAEVIILGSSTVARYVFSSPITWSDELASLVFLWLAMLGSIVALRRGEHMRLTAFVRNLSEEGRAWLDALGMALVIALLLTLLPAALEHFETMRIGTTPVLEISEGYRAAAIVVGFGLMLLTAIDTLLRRASWVQIVAVSGIVAAVVGVLWWLAPTLEDLGNVNLLI